MHTSVEYLPIAVIVGVGMEVEIIVDVVVDGQVELLLTTTEPFPAQTYIIQKSPSCTFATMSPS